MIKMFSKKMKNQKGFTLVELIVVIAIIGILGAIAVPKLGGFRQTAAHSADEATADVIRNAVMVALANGDISLTDASTVGVIDITFESDGTVYKPTNLTETTQDVMKKLLGTDIKAQETNKTGFKVTIDTNGDVEVVVTPKE